jgi:hypothetical protein
MKFRDLKDAHLFLFEIGKTNLIESIKTADWKPSTELLESYIKGRRALIPHLKDFRKSQSAKASWRSNRNKMMAGIKKFHKSTQGKQLHRSLGRYLATRVSKSGRFKDRYDDKYEALKGLSSLRTHLYIETGYFKSVDEQIEFEFFMDEIVPITMSEELKVYKEESTISEEDLDLLCRAISPIDLLKECCMLTGDLYSEELLAKFIDGLSENYSYVECIQNILPRMNGVEEE